MVSTNDTTNATLQDFLIPEPIDDTVSNIKFIPNKSLLYLASAGWDSKIRVWNTSYNVNSMNTGSAQISSQLIFNTQLNDPILSLTWQTENTNLIAGCCDGTVNYIDLNQGKTVPIGKHEIGCKEAIWLSSLNLLMTGGWDGKLNFWDMRQNNPALTLDLQKKIYTMSMSQSLLVVGMSERLVCYFNMNKLSGVNFAAETCFESHLRYQTRAISCFPEGDGYAIGSIEGRVAIKYVDLNKQPEINQETKSMNTTNDFAFRCHRTGDNQSEVYPVNTIAFNQVWGTFTTGGGDGSWIIWDKDSRSRLRQGYQQNRAPVTSVDYSANGDLLAYATGYDWAKGVTYENSFPNPKINIHYCPDLDKKKKQKK
jgi:mRNA export factor